MPKVLPLIDVQMVTATIKKEFPRYFETKVVTECFLSSEEANAFIEDINRKKSPANIKINIKTVCAIKYNNKFYLFQSFTEPFNSLHSDLFYLAKILNNHLLEGWRKTVINKPLGDLGPSYRSYQYSISDNGGEPVFLAFINNHAYEATLAPTDTQLNYSYMSARKEQVMSYL